jgi:hypothetical protein
LRESPHRSTTVVFVGVTGSNPICRYPSTPATLLASSHSSRRIHCSFGSWDLWVGLFYSVLLLPQQITGLGFPLRCNVTSIVAIVEVILFGPTLLQSICLSRCLCRSPMSCIHCISSFWFCRLCRVHQSTDTCSLSGSVALLSMPCCYQLPATDHLFRRSHSCNRSVVNRCLLVVAFHSLC